MAFEVKFNVSNQSFTPSFGEVHNISDGGYERGYEAGYTKGYSEGETAGYAKGEAHGRTEGYAQGKADGHAEGYAEGYAKGYADGYAAGYDAGYGKGMTDGVEQGKQVERDYFWENYKVTRGWDYTFAGAAWTDITFKPTNDLVITASANNMFLNTGIQSLKQILQNEGVVLDVSKATSCYNFARSANITHYPHLDFSNCSKLDTPWNYSKVTELSLSIKEKVQCVNPFQGCSRLTDLTIVSGTFGTSLSFAESPLLSDASIQSVIDHLADLTGATAQTLTLHNDVGNKLTEAQKATITAKNWTLVY